MDFVYIYSLYTFHYSHYIVPGQPNSPPVRRPNRECKCNSMLKLNHLIVQFNCTFNTVYDHKLSIRSLLTTTTYYTVGLKQHCFSLRSCQFDTSTSISVPSAQSNYKAQCNFLCFFCIITHLENTKI